MKTSLFLALLSLGCLDQIRAAEHSDAPQPTITTTGKGIEFALTKAYAAKWFGEQGYWYEDGIPRPPGLPKPRFLPELDKSAFVVIRVKIPAPDTPLGIATLTLTDKNSQVYRPIAINVHNPEDLKEDFAFAYDSSNPGRSMWAKATTIVFPWTEVEFGPGKLFMLGAEKSSPIIVNLIYEVPMQHTELTFMSGN